MTPFITFYTPTYRRPQALARNLASVQAQTCVRDIEQIVIPDHVGLGVGGMFSRVPDYAGAVHGRYVAFLCDDDVLAGPSVVAELQGAAEAEGYPELLVVQTNKGGAVWPSGDAWPPRMGSIDLNCAVVRRDVWLAHVQHYGHRYEGDYDFMHALWVSGVYAVPVDLLLTIGAVSRGVAEVACVD